jgi:type II secretory pathway pseudopilin PulG
MTSFTQAQLNKNKYGNSSTGFTLIELLVSAGIIVMITSIVIVRFVNFDGTVILRSAAYDVATALREAQIYSVSVVNSDDTFRYPYGVTFSPGGTSYTFFQFTNLDASAFPQYDVNDAVDEEEPLRVMNLSESIEIADLCVRVTGNTDPTCGLNRLDVSFRRPEFSALISAPPEGTSEGAVPGISAALIKLQSSRNPGNVWVVEIKLLGQITVYKE